VIKNTPRPINQPRGCEPENSASTSVVKAASRCGSLRGAQIFCGRLAGAAVCNDFERKLLPLVEGAHAGAFNGADMNEDILASLVGLNETKSLLAVKPLHSSRIHGKSSFKISVHLKLRGSAQQAHFQVLFKSLVSKSWGEGRQSGAL
jgi:hypothetical protein